MHSDYQAFSRSRHGKVLVVVHQHARPAVGRARVAEPGAKTSST